MEMKNDENGQKIKMKNKPRGRAGRGNAQNWKKEK